MIAFCLTLYFQSEDTVKTVNLEPSVNVVYNEESSHSLIDLNEKLKPQKIEDIIRNIHERNKMAGLKTRVMEIGAGNGRVLMELKELFPDAEFYGVNKEKTKEFYRRESYAITALNTNIMNKAELDNIELPFVIFQDLDFAGRLPYGENKFDVIYSQNTLRHFKYKFELLNETLRVLKSGGVSMHTDLPAINIYDNGVVLDIDEAVVEFRKRGLDIMLLESKNALIIRKKEDNQIFPLTPHQPIPENLENIPQELRRPEMGYNLL